MKTIGLLGGMSWESSLEYYRIINQTVKEELGGLHSAKLLLYSFDFAEIERLQSEGHWQESGRLLALTAQKLEQVGAEVIVICTNTMHRLAEIVQSTIKIPLLHIADAAAEEVKSQGLRKVGLLGTKFTMEEDFYRRRITENHGIEVIIPQEEERNIIHEVIYNELCLGEIKETSREQFKRIITSLRGKGAEGIILGCTEIPLLVKAEDSPIPIFDTTLIHARRAAQYAIAKEAE